MDLWLLVLREVFWAAVAAGGFAFLFNVPRRALLVCALGGALGSLVRTLLVGSGTNIVVATLAGSAAIGFYGQFLARRWRMPAAVFTISSAIPLVPGIFAFQAMIGFLQVTTTAPTSPLLLQARLVEAGVNVLTTSLLLGAIATGIAAPALLFRRDRPVV